MLETNLFRYLEFGYWLFYFTALVIYSEYIQISDRFIYKKTFEFWTSNVNGQWLIVLRLEVWAGLEPAIGVLQTPALTTWLPDQTFCMMHTLRFF